MKIRFEPSPAWVIATGRRGLSLGKARTIFTASGD
jgi:hypothetical protein